MIALCFSLLEVVMRRGKMSRRKSRSTFTRGALRVHSKNRSRVMRGGIRL